MQREDLSTKTALRLLTSKLTKSMLEEHPINVKQNHASNVFNNSLLETTPWAVVTQYNLDNTSVLHFCKKDNK